MFPYILHKEEAKEFGIKFFYSGKPCKNGHASPRYTSTHMCLECRRVHEVDRIERDPEAHRARSREWYRRNPEKGRASSAAHKAKDPDFHRRRAREWNKSNPDRHRAGVMRWLRANPDFSRANSANRRARKRAAGGKYTKVDIANLLEMQGGCCAYCRMDLSGGFHVDHIIALSNGGSNERNNLQILCAPCNQSKGAKDPIVFAQSLGMLL